jgi:hypothetical protein
MLVAEQISVQFFSAPYGSGNAVADLRSHPGDYRRAGAVVRAARAQRW